jgi:hypothetical protein
MTWLPVIEEPQPGYPESAVGDGRPRLCFAKVPEGNEFCVEMSRAELDAG